MKALPLEQSHLLDLQKTDSQIARIRHQESAHPLWAKLKELQERKEDLQKSVVANQTQMAEAETQAAKTEGEITKVRARKQLQQDRLDQGKVPLRDMSAMEHEIGRMEKRVDDLEAMQLEQLEHVEKLQALIGQIQHQIAQFDEEEQSLRNELDADLEASKEELSRLELKRQKLTESIPENVVATYERLQKHLGVLVVVEVHDGRPVRSPVEISADELSQLAKYDRDQLFISDETEYILVPTTSETR